MASKHTNYFNNKKKKMKIKKKKKMKKPNKTNCKKPFMLKDDYESNFLLVEPKKSKNPLLKPLEFYITLAEKYTNFEIFYKESIGDGASSVVYLGMNIKTKEKVAVKIIRKIKENKECLIEA